MKHLTAISAMVALAALALGFQRQGGPGVRQHGRGWLCAPEAAPGGFLPSSVLLKGTEWEKPKTKLLSDELL